MELVRVKWCAMMHSLISLLVLAIASSTLASVTCIKVGATAKATWVNSAGKTCTWSGSVGSNFGTTSSGSEFVPHCNLTRRSPADRLDSYSCNGRCGAGCTGTAVGNV